MNQSNLPHSIFSSPTAQVESDPTFSDEPRSLSGKFKAPIHEDMTTGLEVLARWIWWILSICGVVTAVCSYFLNTGSSPVTGDDATPLAIAMFGATIFCGAIAGILGISLPILAFFNRRHGKQIDKIRRGEYLARWDLEREQWLAFVEDEKTKAKELVGTTVVIVGALGLLMGIPFWALIGFIGYLAIVTSCVVAGYLLGKLIEFCRRQRLNSWKEKPFFTVIGYEGLFFNNCYYPYSTFGSGLGSVKLMQTDSMTYLEFTFYTQTQNGRTDQERRVPVPFGREDEASTILNRIG